MIPRIGRYEITGQIGKGGFGSVYRGFDPVINQVVAIKVLSASTDPGLATRFRAEAQTAAKIHHANVVTIFQFDEDQGMPYLVMEYLDGVTLQDLITQRVPLSILDKISIMMQTGSGLHCAHENNVVHRDVKPANIMRLKNGTVKIMDFGIARLVDSVSTRLTQTGFMIGTIEYMAPEQFRSSEPDALCDIWSYGVVFYELLAGIHPCYSRDPKAKPDPYTLMHRITMEDPVPISELVPDAPPALARLVQRLLSRDRTERAQSLDDVLLDLAPIQQDLAKVQIPELIRQAEGLAGSDEIEHAQSVIRRVLELDGTNKQARKLRDEIRERARHAANRPKIEEILREADEDAKNGRFDSALSRLQSALKLDPVSNTLRQRIEQVKKREELSKKSNALLNQARVSLNQGDFTIALQRVTEAIETDPDNAQAASLLEAVNRSINDRKRQTVLQKGLTEANHLIVIQAYDEALQTLNGLLEKTGPDEQVLRRIEEVRQLKRMQETQERVNAGINAARDLLKRENFEEACRKLEELDRFSPGNPAIELLLNNARERAQGQQLQAKVAGFLQQAAQERAAKRFDQAMRTLQQAIDLDPLNANVLAMQRTILDELKAERENRQLETELTEVKALFNQGRLAEARVTADRLVAAYPGDRRAAQLAAEVQQTLQTREHEKRKEFEKGLKEAEEHLRSGRIENATSLLGNLKDRYEDNDAVTRLFGEAQRLEFDRQRQEEINATVAEARKLAAAGKTDQAIDRLKQGLRKFPDSKEYLDELHGIQNRESWDRDFLAVSEALQAGRVDDALQIAERLLRDRPGDPKATALQQEAQTESGFRNLARRVRSLMETGDFEQAEELVRKGAARFGEDPRLLKITGELKNETLRRNAIKAAQQALRSQNFEAARKSVRSILEIFPDDAAARQLNSDIDSEESTSRRRSDLQEKRKAFEQYLRAQQFNEAIREIQQLLVRYPDESGLREELARAEAARDEAGRRGAYNKGREEAQRLLTQRKFDEASTVLSGLLAQYPGDALLTSDLKAIRETLQLRELRQKIDARIATIEASFKAGDAEAVLKSAKALLAEAEEPRARELLDWAQRSLAQAKDIRKQGKDKRPLVFGGIGAAVLAVAGFVFMALPKTKPAGSVAVQPSEIAFVYQKGETAPASKKVSIKTQDSAQNWTLTQNSKWLGTSATSGQGSTDLDFQIDASSLKPGEYNDIASINSGSVRQDVRIHLTVTDPKGDAAKLPPPPPVPTGADAARLRVEPNVLAFSYQEGGQHPAPQAVHVSSSDPKQAWTVSKADTWIVPVRSSGNGDAALGIAVDPSKLGPGDHTSIVFVRTPGQERQVRVALHVAPPTSTAGQANPQTVSSTPATPALVAIALEPAISCTSGYTGNFSGRITWNGELPAGGSVSIGRHNVATHGAAKLNALPGCDVTVSVTTPGLAVDERPAASNNFGKLTLRNTSPNTITAIQLKWDVK